MKPKTVSIVTPVYNQGHYVAQTIESIINQKGNFYIDYVVIDDGSSDNSLEVVKKYDTLVNGGGSWKPSCLGVTFCYRSRPNTGQTKALNEGFQMITGDIVAWMNSDDYYFSGAFQAAVDCFNAHPGVDLVYGQCQKVFETEKRTTIYPLPREQENLETLRTRGNSFELNFFTHDALKRVGYLDENYNYCMDLELWFHIFATGGKAQYLPFVIGAFRIWPGSKTSTKQTLFAKERERIAKKYGGNAIPAKAIHRFRKKLPLANFVQTSFPGLYQLLKSGFYSVVDLFRHKA